MSKVTVVANSAPELDDQLQAPYQYTGGRRGECQSNIIEGASEIVSLWLSLGSSEHEDEHKIVPLQINVCIFTRLP